MIEISRTLPVNDGTLPELGVADVWAGLVEKAANPMPYVKSITSCTVIDRFEGGLVRDIIHVGQPVRETVTFHPKRLVHFVRTHGSARGTIDNELGHDADGALTLTFRFRIAVDGVEPGSAQEDGFAANMEADYLDAVRTTLAAVRELVSGTRTMGGAAEPVPAPEFVREVFQRVDAFVPAFFAELFAPDGTLVFGNGDPMVGPAAIESGVAGFFGTIKGLRHRIVDEWHQQGSSVVELETTYDRLDGKQVTIPVVSIFHRRDNGLIDRYRVYFDLAPVFA
jgi:ketosteroid isomerase-like protein